MSPEMETFTLLAREHEIRRLLGESGEDLLVDLRAAWDDLSAQEQAELVAAERAAAVA